LFLFLSSLYQIQNRHPHRPCLFVFIFCPFSNSKTKK